MSLAAHINERIRLVERNPTEGQKAAGNYRKGHVRLHGLDISIENPRGSCRSGRDPETGKAWRSRLPHHYGYIRGTEGSDGDHVDVFLGPHLRSPAVYVIDQKDLRTGDHDEHKVMLGFASLKQACRAYCDAFSDGRGRSRISHVEGLTMEKFKEWLKGDTKSPIKRAAGGGVQSRGDEIVWEAPPEEDVKWETAPSDDAGGLDAFARGAAQGATFNLGDEMAAAHAAGPRIAPGGMIGRTILGGAQTGIDKLRGRESESTRAFDERLAEVRKGNEAAKRNRPWTYGGGQLAGMVPSMAAVPGAGAVTRMGISAATPALRRFGAEALDAGVQGGIAGGVAGAGEGEGLGDRAMKGAEGIVSGIVGGPLAAGASALTRGAYDKFVRPVVGTVRGWMNPTGEAARRTGTALRADQEMIQQGTARGLTTREWAAARQRGEPVTLADLGAGHTQSLLRSSANTDPAAREMLEGTFSGPGSRFESQSERVGDTVRNILPGGRANARKTADQLVAEYDAARVPAYKTAYQQGDQPIFTRAMEKLLSSPTVEAAMKRAISSGRDRDVTMGFGGFNPRVSIVNDKIVFNRGADGMPIPPNLQYWDAVKRELDDVASKAGRSGAKGEAEVAGSLAKILRNELDSVVPSYKKARGIAEDFFGEKNALEAGRALAGKKPVAEDVSALMRKMDPQERELFREGYASEFVERVIGRMKDTQDITKAMFNSPNERKLAAAIYGPGGMAQLQARMALETIMNGARNALGNSTTARQLIEAGLAGGALSGYASGWDPGSMMAGATGLAGARWGKGAHAGLEHMATGAKHLIGKVDAKTARRVAELLTSDDPRLLREGFQLAAKNEAIKSRLTSLANRVYMAGQGQLREPAGAGMKYLQKQVNPAAEEEQQRP